MVVVMSLRPLPLPGLSLRGAGLLGRLNVVLQLRKRALRLSQIAGLEILPERREIGLDRGRSVRTRTRSRRALGLHQLLEIRVVELRGSQVAGLKITGQLGVILLSRLFRTNLLARLGVTLQL